MGWAGQVPSAPDTGGGEGAEASFRLPLPPLQAVFGALPLRAHRAWMASCHVHWERGCEPSSLIGPTRADIWIFSTKRSQCLVFSLKCRPAEPAPRRGLPGSLMGKPNPTGVTPQLFQ